ncbi:MAG: serine/threonine protein kinase [Olsenella sp.]|nr:serine/threonine protein kinase [Olsenella sp.]
MSANVTGGFGTVLTCWDTRLQRRVAIKRMPIVSVAADGRPQTMTSTMDEALAEARTSSMLAHPNIVTMFDFEVDQTSAYLVMEYVDGLTLAELLSRVEGGTLTPDECSYLVQSVAKALQFAHENGVLHLDIKPSNIMINHAGTVKLCDFGMASLASASGYGGARGGTVGFMPPEQIRGDMVDERCDVFSLAVVVWQALTGSSPFVAPTAEESLVKIERGPKPKLSKIDPALAGMAEEAIMQALDPNPAMRIPSIEAFANEVSFGLGNAEAGAASIRGLMSQDVADDEGEDEWDPGDLPLSYRYPWLPGAIERGSAAVVTFCMMLTLAPCVLAALGIAGAGGGMETAGTDIGAGVEGAARAAGLAPTLLASTLCAGLAALWPPSGSALVVVSLAFAMATGSTAGGAETGASAASFLLPAVTGVIWLVWWLKIGIRERLSTPTLLLASALGSPVGASAGAAYTYGPAHAAATSAAAWALSTLYICARACTFDAGTTASLLAATLARPSVLALGLGCVVAAAVGSAICRWREGTAAGIASQVTCAIVLIGFQLVGLRVENGGIWVAPSWESVVVALLLCVLLCITTSIRGPQHEEWEVEDTYEPA